MPPIAQMGGSGGEGLFEQTLAGKALADDGNVYDTIQAAENAASGMVVVGPGTFQERVDIDTAGLWLVGSGRGTVIDGDSDYAIVANESNIIIENLAVTGTPGGDSSGDAIGQSTNGDSLTIRNVWVLDSDRHGIRLNNGADHLIEGVTVESCDNRAIYSETPRTIVTECLIKSPGTDGFLSTADDQIVSKYIVTNPTEECVDIAGNDSVVYANRLIGAGTYGIRAQGGALDNVIVNNRVSDSTTSDINDSGTGNLVSDNKTGASN